MLWILFFSVHGFCALQLIGLLFFFSYLFLKIWSQARIPLKFQIQGEAVTQAHNKYLEKERGYRMERTFFIWFQ